MPLRPGRLPTALDFESSGISNNLYASSSTSAVGAASANNGAAGSNRNTPPLSPAVMLAAERSKLRKGRTPRNSGGALLPPPSPGSAVPSPDHLGIAMQAAADAELPINAPKPNIGVIGDGRIDDGGFGGMRPAPISPRVMTAALHSKQRRQSYKLSKEELRIPSPLAEARGEEEEEDDDDEEEEGGRTGPVYSMQHMEDIRVAMGSRSTRMVQKYNIEAVDPLESDRPASSSMASATRPTDAGSGWRGRGGTAGGGRDGRWAHLHLDEQGASGPGSANTSMEREVVDSDIDDSVPRQSGVIVFMPNNKYGFIRPEKRPTGAAVVGGQGKQGDYFFHATEIKDAVPQVGDHVTFQIARPQWSDRILAVRVQIVEGPPAPKSGFQSQRGAHGSGRKFRSHYSSSGGGRGHNNASGDWRMHRSGGASGGKQAGETHSHSGHYSSSRRWGGGPSNGWRGSSSSSSAQGATPERTSRQARGPTSGGFVARGPSSGGAAFESRVAHGPSGNFGGRGGGRSRNGGRPGSPKRSLNTKAVSRGFTRSRTTQ